MTPLTVFSVSSHPSSPSPLPGEEQVSWRVSQRLLEFTVEQLQQSDLHLGDPRLLAGCGKQWSEDTVGEPPGAAC